MGEEREHREKRRQQVLIDYPTARQLLDLIAAARGGDGMSERELNGLMIRIARYLPDDELPD